MPPAKFTDVVNWNKLGSVGGILLAVTMLGLCHYTHASILTKAVADSPTNWNIAYGEMLLGAVAALVAVVSSWRGTTGQAAVVIGQQKQAKPADDETVEVLLQKIEHRCRQDAANAILKGVAGGTSR